MNSSGGMNDISGRREVHIPHLQVHKDSDGFVDSSAERKGNLHMPPA